MSTAFDELMAVRARPEDPSATITGADPVYSTRFRLAETAAGIMAACGVAASDIWEMKSGRRQSVSVDVRHAGAAINCSEHMQVQQADGSFLAPGDSPLAQTAYQCIQPFPTRDGRYFLPHIGIKHLKEKVLGILGCEATPAEVAKAIAKWDAQELEDAIAAAGACGGITRTAEEWLAHPQGQALAAQAVVEIEKVADSDPEPFPADGLADGRPLAGLRVLDLTRVLAGPVAAKTLAEHGADVLMIGAKHVPQFKKYVMDLSPGKRSTFLDMRDAEQAEQLRNLVRQADVFSQGYRPGALGKHGFGVEDLTALRPGLIYTSINCYGQTGPFSDRAGWEQVAQSVTGICHENGTPPALLPVPVCDYTTGYLGAYGTMLALARRAREGGSYHVKVSLCQTAMFIQRQGRVDYPAADMDLAPTEIDPLLIEHASSYGRLRQLGPLVRVSETKPGWQAGPPALGGDEARWLA